MQAHRTQWMESWWMESWYMKSLPHPLQLCGKNKWVKSFTRGGKVSIIQIIKTTMYILLQLFLQSLFQYDGYGKTILSGCIWKE